MNRKVPRAAFASSSAGPLAEQTVGVQLERPGHRDVLAGQADHRSVDRLGARRDPPRHVRVPGDEHRVERPREAAEPRLLHFRHDALGREHDGARDRTGHVPAVGKGLRVDGDAAVNREIQPAGRAAPPRRAETRGAGVGVDRVRRHAQIEPERLRVARDQSGERQPLAGDREGAFVDPDGVAGDVEAEALDPDRDVPALQDVDPVALERCRSALERRGSARSIVARKSPRSAPSPSGGWASIRASVRLSSLPLNVTSTSSPPTSASVVSVSGSFTASRRRSKWPGRVVRSNRRARRRRGRATPARGSGRLAAGAPHAPGGEGDRRARHHLARQPPARGRPSRLRSPARASASARSKLRAARRIVLYGSGCDHSCVEHRCVEPVERDRARRDAQLAARERRRRGQHRSGEPHRLRADHRLIVERRRRIERAGQPARAARRRYRSRSGSRSPGAAAPRATRARGRTRRVPPRRPRSPRARQARGRARASIAPSRDGPSGRSWPFSPRTVTRSCAYRTAPGVHRHRQRHAAIAPGRTHPLDVDHHPLGAVFAAHRRRRGRTPVPAAIRCRRARRARACRSAAS